MLAFLGIRLKGIPALFRVNTYLWIALLGLGLALAGFSVAMMCPAPDLPDVMTTASAHLPKYFVEERFAVFSGNDFNLLPDLITFLDQLEQNLISAPVKASAPLGYADYFRFINPDYVTFQVYAIQLRDNYWKVSKQYGYTIDTIVGCNPQLEKMLCFIGQKILLPSRGGSLHCVQPDETLDTIALEYVVNPETILKANRISDRWGILPGMWLFIPGAKPRHLSHSMYKEYSKRALFRSPLSGRYTSFVGNRIHPILGFSKYHNGVDIACHYDTWVGSAAAGTVEYAGWGDAIGKYIKINHHNGYETIYGHLNKIYIRPGQKVRGGQLIGRSGSTGRSTGPHLHFAIYDNGRVVDPMDYLW